MFHWRWTLSGRKYLRKERKAFILSLPLFLVIATYLSGEIPRSRFFNRLIRQRFFSSFPRSSRMSRSMHVPRIREGISDTKLQFKSFRFLRAGPQELEKSQELSRLPFFSRSQLKLRLVYPQSIKRTGRLKTISVIPKTAEWHQIHNLRRDINRFTGLRRTPRIVRSVTQSACKSTTMFYYLSFPRVYSYMEVINSFYGREHWKKEEEGKKEGSPSRQ